MSLDLSRRLTAPVERVALSPPFVPETFKNPPWDEQTDFSSFLSCMQKGELIYSRPMRDFLKEKGKEAIFDNEVHYGILKEGDSYVAVAYKPKEGEAISAAYAEKVAYDVSEKAIAPYTGHRFIPPTLVRTLPDGRIACFQFFVETENREDLWNASFRAAVFQNAPPESIQEMAVFNAVFNIWDRHPGNFLATLRDGRFHLASIDNESIENKGRLLRWGERAYIPVAFTEDDRAKTQKELKLAKDLTLEGLRQLLQEHGFEEIPKLEKIFTQLADKGEENQTCLIADGSLSIRYHQGNEKAFPLPKGPYSPSLVAVYRQLDRKTLEGCFQPLVELDPKRFGGRVQDILERRDLLLKA